MVDNDDDDVNIDAGEELPVPKPKVLAPSFAWKTCIGCGKKFYRAARLSDKDALATCMECLRMVRSK